MFEGLGAKPWLERVEVLESTASSDVARAG